MGGGEVITLFEQSVIDLKKFSYRQQKEETVVCGVANKWEIFDLKIKIVIF